jgi:hypothetical protein
MGRRGFGRSRFRNYAPVWRMNFYRCYGAPIRIISVGPERTATLMR